MNLIILFFVLVILLFSITLYTREIIIDIKHKEWFSTIFILILNIINIVVAAITIAVIISIILKPTA